MAKAKQSAKVKGTRDADLTKKLILDAAEVEFAKQGLKGTRVDRIAKAAGVASRMIYYYFESKEGLYKTVLQRPADDISRTIQDSNLDGLSPDKALANLLKAAISYEINHRYRGMLLFQEANQNQGKYFKLTNWEMGITMVEQILQRGIDEGVFRPLDTYMTTLQIIGSCVFYANAHENLKHLTPEQDLLSQEMIERYTESAIQLMLGGVLRVA
ncbi:TetR family transcriptional regulator [Hyella patelloides LEGE 07179]|uniref:TetR family transcriptional regulator n=1 Tax=Hyella patelloides LEGE 07179 TaxID=945734 RepID=A0A563W261_9CYAN|nr:TetR/AcrR family transcriptional regulator [Hyella patelloides]VEP17789.1 TetR family transcriptional regulator [Hyella patelloides LEGE 07179]